MPYTSQMPYTAVVVSDDTERLQAFASAIEELGIGVEACQGSKEALAFLARAGPVDAIVTDLSLRWIDGPQLCRLIRSPEYAAHNDVPVVICSHKIAGAQMARVYRELEAAAFLEGPFDARMLAQQVRAVLTNKNTRQDALVLVVEPNENLAADIARTFEQRGFKAHLVQSGQAGRERFTALVPDIVILNTRLPDMQGLKLLKEVKRIVPKTVVVMTLDANDRTTATSLVGAGADACFRIPVDPPRLVSLCEAVQMEREFARITDLLQVQNEREQWMEDQLNSQRAELERILDAVPAFISYKDKEHRFVRVNKAFADALGLSQKDMIGKTMAELFRDAESIDLGRYARDDNEVMRTGVPKNGILEPYPSVHGLRWARTDKVPHLDNDGETIGVISLSVDITQEAKLEEQLRQSQKMEAIGQLAGGVAHDFNNLLSGILGHANLLMMDLTPGTPPYESVLTIENAAKRAADLTSQLLGFAREGKMREVPCDINGIICDVIGLLARTINKTIRQSHNLRSDLPLVVGDPGQLQQVFVNLAVNARDAMPNGGDLRFETDLVLLDEAFCSAHPGVRIGEFVMITVADTGPGIPHELRGRVFEPFFTTKEPGKGTGLGLAMVYGIVRNHDGLVEILGDREPGTTFAVYLPVNGKTHSTPPRMSNEKPVQGSGRILLVDDEELVRNIAGRMLRRLGYEVEVAEHGQEALLRYRERGRNIDLVIIDCDMPKMDGYRCFYELKKINPRVKAILSTGFGLDAKVQQALNEGLVGFVPKPYNLLELSLVVKNALIKKS